MTKELGGNDAEEDREFTFTVTLKKRADGAKLDGTYTCTGTQTSLKFKLDDDGNAVATFKLKGGESLTIEDILDLTEYTVVETDPTQYGYFTYIGEEETREYSSTISDEEGAENAVTFTNVRNTGSIVLGKKFDGTGKNTVTTYSFTVKLWRDDDIKLTDNNLPTGATFTYDKDEGDYGTYTATVNVSVGKTLTIKDILTDTNVSIVEESYIAEGYTATTVEATEEGATTSDTDRSAESIITTGEQTVTYTNIRNAAPLTVTKKLDGNAAEEDREFTFTVTLTKRDDGAKLGGTYTCTDKDGKQTSLEFTQSYDEETGEPTSDAVATFTLKGGESLTIEDILDLTEYTVEETDPTQYGYFTYIGGKETREYSSTISDEEGAENAVTFTNVRNTGSITLTKQVSGSGRTTVRNFTFTIKLWRDDAIKLTGVSEPDGLAFDYADPYDNYAYGVYTATVTLNLDDDEDEMPSIKIGNILTDTHCSITEQSYLANGYQEVSINGAGPVTVPKTEAEKVLTYTTDVTDE